ncbi:hypothetical protein [Pseudohongiella sp. O18]|uniref:hypothetical protein n=1 Tax=Pseudohongiella sp. O18 TaxID=2904248 RepID=UPI001F4809A2|nr:hypothetical protein [Pseudohongiella sp. O18]
MKALPIVALLLVTLLPPALGLAQSYQPDPAQTRALAYFKGDDEPSVRDAIWASESVFRVGMINDGTDRSGFARYVCQVLNSDFSIRGVEVQVIDIAILARDGRWERIGRARCD